MNLYRKIDRSKLQFDFVYFTADHCDYDDEIELLGGRIHRIRTAHAGARFLALYSLLRSGGWTIIHSHTLFSSSLHLAAARLAGVPQRIAHSHSTQDANSASRWGRAYQRFARRLIGWVGTEYLACGHAAAKFLFPGRNDVLVLPNGIDIQSFEGASRADARNNLGVSPSQLLVLQVGRLMPVKNHARSIRIADEMRKIGLDFQMLLVGAGPEKHRIQKLITNSDLDQHVRLLGLRSDMPDLMVAADVMILPSLYEGFSLALVEAQAAGLPSVVSNGVPQEVDLGMGMLRFVRLDASDSEWIEALQMAASGQVPGSQARRDVLEHAGFSAAAGARKLEQAYRVV